MNTDKTTNQLSMNQHTTITTYKALMKTRNAATQLPINNKNEKHIHINKKQ